MSATVKETDELRRLRDELEVAEARATRLFNLTPVGVFLTDEKGSTTYVNRMWCELTGFSADAALGFGWLDAIHPEDRDRLRANWEAASRRHDASGEEYRMLRPDGSVIRVIGQANPETNPEGRVVGYVGTIVDISQRKQVEAELRETNQLLSSFIRHSPIFAFIKDVSPGQSRVLKASENYRDMIGIPGSEMAGKTMEELFPPEFAAKITADDWAVVSRGEVLQLEEEFNGRSHTTIKFPIRLGDKHFLAGYTIDITDRKRAQDELMHSRAQLLQSQKLEAVGRLAGGVAHDFNNILQALLSLATVLRMRVGSPELASIVGEIEAHVMRGAGLTQQLLLFSRRQTTEKEKVDLVEVVEAVGELLRRLIPENTLFSVDVPTTPLWVFGDALQLQQVLMNLAINAKDAMPGGGTLTMRAFRNFGEAALEVTDSGCGMDEAIRERLFEPFFTTKETGKGTGLGLSVVHGIVEQHEGRVEIKSAPGEGSRFRVILPLLEVPEGESVRPRRQLNLPRGRGERILLVEDESGVRGALAMLLETLGYQVTDVGSGEEAIESVAETAPDLLLTDLVLPGVDGASLAARLRDRWPGLKVVLMSGYTEDEVVRRNIDDGSVHFLQKPFDMRSLACEVSAALIADYAE